MITDKEKIKETDSYHEKMLWGPKSVDKQKVHFRMLGKSEKSVLKLK